MKFWLHNPSIVAVEVTRVETSCPCFEIELQQKVIGPGEKVAAIARLDLAGYPRFVGWLRLEASGVANSKGIKAFMIYGTVNVASPKAGGGE